MSLHGIDAAASTAKAVAITGNKTSSTTPITVASSATNITAAPFKKSLEPSLNKPSFSFVGDPSDLIPA